MEVARKKERNGRAARLDPVWNAECELLSVFRSFGQPQHLDVTPRFFDIGLIMLEEKSKMGKLLSEFQGFAGSFGRSAPPPDQHRASTLSTTPSGAAFHALD